MLANQALLFFDQLLLAVDQSEIGGDTRRVELDFQPGLTRSVAVAGKRIGARFRRAIGQYVGREARGIGEYVDELNERSPFVASPESETRERAPE